jgi:hypothetical protein
VGTLLTAEGSEAFVYEAQDGRPKNLRHLRIPRVQIVVAFIPDSHKADPIVL